MGLSAQNFAIVPTPSGILDGHFPDGNDGTGAIPLRWATVPSFLQKQVGTPFSIDLFATYLTQPGAPAATASVSVGALSGGWTLNSAGLLAYSGVGQGTGTIRVRATRLGVTSDSNLFTFESIATIVSSDTLPPTIPTGVALVSKTATSITMSSDVPADVPTSLIPASGYKETRWFKAGLIDGVSSFGAGLTLRLTKLDVAPSTGRRLPLGSLSTVSKSQRDSFGGVPGYSVGPGITGVVIRYRWGPDLEPGAAGAYDFTSRMDAEVLQAAALGVSIIFMIEVRTFDANKEPNPMPGYLADLCSWFISGTGQPAASLIATVTGNVTSGSKVIASVSSTAGIIDGGGLADSNGSISTSARVVSHTSNTITMDRAALSSKTGDSISYYQVPDGYQGWRWHNTVLTAFQNLVNAIGARYGPSGAKANSAVAGVATQETSNGGIANGVGGYSPTVYANALISENGYISSALSVWRHWYYFNFMSGTGTKAALQSVVTAMQTNGNGTVVGFPDLVTGNTTNTTGIVNNVYDIVQGYHNSGGYTFGCVQQSEWTGSGTPAPSQYMSELFNFGTASATYPTTGYPASVNDWSGPPPTGAPTSPLKLDAIVYNVQQGNNSKGEQFSTTIIGTNGIAPNNPAPIGSLSAVVGSSMTPGSITQTGPDYDVLSFGTGINTADDQWTAANGAVNGDVTVICKYASLTGGDLTSAAVMGISIRDASGPTARSVYLVATGSLLRSRYRLSSGSAVVNLVDVASQGWTVPKWVKITRVANLFSFFYSTDSITWTACGTVTLAMATSVFVQLFAATTGTTSVTGHFQQVNVQQLAKINYTFTGLTTATAYSLTAVGRDLANNDSAASPAVTITTS